MRVRSDTITDDDVISPPLKKERQVDRTKIIGTFRIYILLYYIITNIMCHNLIVKLK